MQMSTLEDGRLEDIHFPGLVETASCKGYGSSLAEIAVENVPGGIGSSGEFMNIATAQLQSGYSSSS